MTVEFFKIVQNKLLWAISSQTAAELIYRRADASRTGQEYNQRKNRNGAFWEDRYHATAVSSDRHLIQCIAYIDLNMVRAGVVNHPSEWNFGGYNEIQK